MEDLLSCALPGVDENIIIELNAKLIEIGVLSFDDLKYVEEEYIKNILKPVQLKKFLDFCKTSEVVPPCSIEDINSNASISSIASSTSVLRSSSVSNILLSENWAENFNLPLESFPKEIEEAEMKKQQPPRSRINEMIRLVISKVLNFDECPGRKNLRIIAQKIIDKFPNCFEDRFGSLKVGDGLTTLVKRLENCVDNKKRVRSTVEEYYNEIPKKKKNQRQSYGCGQWQPEINEKNSKEQLTIYRNWLCEEHKKCDKDEAKVQNLMNKTYALQRYFINNVKLSINSVKEQWPFLLDCEHLLSHSSVLLEKDIKQIFENFPEKGKKIYDFMKTQSNPRIKKTIKEIESVKLELNNIKPEYIGALPLLMAYFEEEESLLFKEFLGPDDIEKENNLTPYLATFGCNLYDDKEYALVIDGQVTTYCGNFLTALTALFCSYYAFNIEYNNGTSITMEFIQRAFGTQCMHVSETGRKSTRKIIHVFNGLKYHLLQMHCRYKPKKGYKSVRKRKEASHCHQKSNKIGHGCQQF